MQAGHVFLVLGDLERLTCDHVVIPGESASPWGVRPGSKWSVVKKESEPDPGLFEDPEKRFRQWAARRPHSHAQAGRDIRDAPAVWVVRAHDTDVVSLLTDLLEAIAEEDPPSSQTRRLVALPLVSTGGGGHLPGVANLLQQLLPRLSELASDTGLDIALVFRGEEPSGGGLDGRAAYAAAQAIRLQQPGRYWPDRRHQYLVEKLAGAAASNHLALFLGAGVSMAAGLPSWDDLLVDLAGDSPSLGKLLDDTEPGSLDPLLRGQLLAAEMSAGELYLRAIGHMVHRHQRNRTRAKDPHTVEIAAAKKHGRETHVVTRRRDEAAAAREELQIGRVTRFPGRVDSLVALFTDEIVRGETIKLLIRHRKTCVRHIERVKDALLHEHIECLP